MSECPQSQLFPEDIQFVDTKREDEDISQKYWHVFLFYFAQFSSYFNVVSLSIKVKRQKGAQKYYSFTLFFYRVSPTYIFDNWKWKQSQSYHFPKK